MKAFSKALLSVSFYLLFGAGIVTAANTTLNQTDDVSPVLPETNLPFTVSIEKASFELPAGFHSGLVGVSQGLWVFISGSVNGLHGFANNPFPPDKFNKRIFVVDPVTGITKSRSLKNPSSGLSQFQIDSLAVLDPQGFQDGDSMIMTGGYGYDTASQTFDTKDTLTKINLPGIIQWVLHPENKGLSVVKNINQIRNPVFRVTGGEMFKFGNLIQLVFGQNFEGVYNPATSGKYTKQIRRFQLIDNKGKLSVNVLPSKPVNRNRTFRRRDLNIVPVILNVDNVLQAGLVAYAGVFTPAGGVWTVPVVINQKGKAKTADPNLSTTFKQAMNQYDCPTVNFYSTKNTNMYTIFFGGISYGFFDNGTFKTDPEIPFINQVTTIQMDKSGNFSQYLMNAQYPVILSTRTNPGNQLLFGASGYFLPTNLIQYENGVISLDNITKPTMIGYIAGGIQSTLPDTNNKSDSSASPQVFKVTLTPK